MRQPKTQGVCSACAKPGKLFPDGRCFVCESNATKYLPSEIPDKYGGYNAPPTWTDATPGSEAKMLILEERARLGCSLHHAFDEKLCTHGLTVRLPLGKAPRRHS